MASTPHDRGAWGERPLGEPELYAGATPGITSDSEVRRHVLPQTTPVMPGMVVTARTDQRSHAGPGGDWFECVALPSGGLGIAVGDVLGTGLGAAAVMAQLRAVAAEALLSGCSPEEVLARLDRLAKHVPTAHGSSAVVVLLEPTGELSLAHRGHPPPLSISAGGAVRVVQVGPSAPLGLGTEAACTTDHLGRGDLLVMYTDGALPPWSPATGDGVEGLRRFCSRATARALATAGAWASDREEGGLWGLAGPNSPLFSQTPRTAADDETTVVTVEIRQPPPALAEFVGPVDRPAAARGTLEGWLLGVGARETDIFALHHAVSEVLSSLEHDGHLPSRADGHLAHLEASLAPEGWVNVGIFPVMAPANDIERAARVRAVDRACSLIRMLGLVDHAEPAERSGAAGVALQHVVARPVCFDPHRGQREAAYHGLDVRAGPRQPGARVLAVHGAVDRKSVEDLRLAIAAAERSGQRLVVDLNDVSVLGSAGVTVLHDAIRRGGTRLVARSSSAAGAVMRRVALPFSDEEATPMGR